MLRVGVVGVGHLGRYHAEKYSLIENVQLIGLADILPERAEALAAKLGVRAFYDYRDLYGQVDAVSVAVPTEAHFEVTRGLMSAGIHILLEKPITRTIGEADVLVALAKEKNLVFQVGLLERFNPAMVAARPLIDKPLYIEANRLSPFSERGTDVDVVLDLMIHDIDMTLDLVQAEPRTVSAVGVPVITSKVDIANARLEFEYGCVANLNASRISAKTQRKFRIFQRDAYLSLDFNRRGVNISRRMPGQNCGQAVIQTEALQVCGHDSLEMEIRSFIKAVIDGTTPEVTGDDGQRSLAVALRIMEEIEARQKDWKKNSILASF